MKYFIKTFLTLLTLGVFLMAACQNKPRVVDKQTDTAKNNFNESMIQVNKYLLKQDMEKIRNLAQHNNWEMQISQTGLHYQIYQSGNGAPTRIGQQVVLAYELYVIDSLTTISCYSSDSLGYKVFRLGQGGVEIGLEEGLLKMRQGDKARLILPPYLAHGLIGDENCIPARAILLYDIELIEIK